MKSIFIILVSLFSFSAFASNVDEALSAIDIKQPIYIFQNGKHQITLKNCTPLTFNKEKRSQTVGVEYDCNSRWYAPSVGAYFGEKNGQIYFEVTLLETPFAYYVDYIEGNNIYLGARLSDKKVTSGSMSFRNRIHSKY